MEEGSGEVIAFSTGLAFEDKEATPQTSHTLVIPGGGPGIFKKPHPLGAKEVVVEGPETLASVVAAVSPAHQVLDDQADVNEADSVVRGQVPLSGTN
jgi:hypothetical protein